ncbi:non-homologous end-joining DNA ligase [Paeniglutamicibacter kerguelensis]|uniref:DNA ligase D-like protein (Predicted polymerase) n=1 Tax=Paeniglutamicibacter kerguelensis TaxID=254788 RepID=A0ABS4XER4_9MICC|nr:non-homologous end-joining DNA ligase [Paeniglutamicibacter kerguelensis]MBP2386169.1 DNA ligase D-like protein (predicted polymerase) [Paeniglutamicibacter kerguelensis]
MSAQELEVDGATVRLTNPGKVLYPESGTTKLDVAMYYLQVAPVLLPWAKNRPATRKRWVDGVGTEACPGKSFFQKNLDAATPEWVQRQRVHHMDHDNIYPLVNDARTLVWLAQTATLEIHVPQWKLASDGVPQNPDRLVLDLDPGEGTGLSECAAVALLVRVALAQIGFDSLPVTSGSKGMHVYARLDGQKTSGEAADLAHELALSIEHDHPEMVVSRMGKELRRGKVFIDWSQNWPGKTTVAPYSLRGRMLPTVAVPRSWDEIDQVGLGQLAYREVLARVEAGINPGL